MYSFFNRFRIRCKVINISPIRFFGDRNQVFDAIVCDSNGEIKIVAFNDEVNRLYININLNQVKKNFQYER